MSRRQRTPKIVRTPCTVEPAPGMRRVTVNTFGDGFTSVDAWVYGEWAAHLRIGGGKVWDVTFLPAARNITNKHGRSNIDRKLSEEQAKRLADWLNSHISRDELYDWSCPSSEVAALIYQGLGVATESVDEWLAEKPA